MILKSLRRPALRESVTFLLILQLCLAPLLQQRVSAAIVDNNGDGLPDGWAARYSVLPYEAHLDRDFDGFTAIQEALAGTNPNDARSRLSAGVLLGQSGRPVIDIPTVRHKRYQLEASPDMLTWTAEGAPFDGDGSVRRLDNLSRSGNARYYRLAMVEDRDRDSDGISDWEEAELYGTAIANADTDGDGFSDGEEIGAGTDPKSQSSKPLKMLKVAGDEQVLEQDQIASEPLMVQLTGSHGTPVAGRTVEFRSLSGDMLLNEAGTWTGMPVSRTTDAAGECSISCRAGSIETEGRIQAALSGGGAAPVVFQFPVRLRLDAPRFSHPSLTLEYPVWVQILSDTAGATVHYTTDGSEPTQASPVYDPQSPILVDRTMTIRAVAKKGGRLSKVASGSWKWPSVRIRNEYLATEAGFFYYHQNPASRRHYPQITGVRDYASNGTWVVVVDAAGEVWAWGTGNPLSGYTGSQPLKVAGLTGVLRVASNLYFLMEDGTARLRSGLTVQPWTEVGGDLIDLQANGVVLHRDGRVFRNGNWITGGPMRPIMRLISDRSGTDRTGRHWDWSGSPSVEITEPAAYLHRRLSDDLYLDSHDRLYQLTGSSLQLLRYDAASPTTTILGDAFSSATATLPYYNFWGSNRVAAGAWHNLILRNGKLYAFGDSRALGTGAEIPAGQTVVQPSGLREAIEIDAGGAMWGTGGHSIAWDTTNRIWTWGNNKVGQLGIGNTTTVPTPVNPSGVTGGNPWDIFADQSICRLGSATGTTTKWWGGGRSTPATGGLPNGSGEAKYWTPAEAPGPSWQGASKHTAYFVIPRMEVAQDGDVIRVELTGTMRLPIVVDEFGKVWQRTEPGEPFRQVPGLHDIVKLDADGGHAIAMRKDGEVFIWSRTDPGGDMGDAIPRQFRILAEPTAATASTTPQDWQRLHTGQTGLADEDDYDGDGVSNLAEYRRGSSPARPDPDPSPGASLVGTTSGQLNVGVGGEAAYSIPITVPAGPAGFAPRLELRYHSQTGNGPLGMGWSFSGLGRITRGGSNPAKDAILDPVDFDGNDWLYLNGERLVAVNGAYGADGTEYRLENDNQTRVISYGRVGDGPASFKVWLKSGEIMTYGSQTGEVFQDNVNSRSTPPPNFSENYQNRNGTVMWHVSEIADRSGNAIHIRYENVWSNNPSYTSGQTGAFQLANADPLQVVPVALVYGSAASLRRGESAGYVKLLWESRSDRTSGYAYDYSLGQQRRLRSITTGFGPVAALKTAGAISNPSLTGVLRRYLIAYRESDVTGRSLLASVQEECGDGRAFPALEFTYSAGAVQEGYTGTQHYFYETKGKSGQNAVLQLPIDLVDSSGRTRGVRFADLNGDSFPDIIRAQRVSGTVQFQAFIQDPSYLPNFGPFGTRWAATTTSYAFPSGVALANGTDTEPHVFLADINADGLTDLMRIGIEGGETSETWINEGGQFVNRAEWRVPAVRASGDTKAEGVALQDVDGDGFTDVLLSYRRTGGTLQRELFRGSSAGFVWGSADAAAWRNDWALPEPLGEDGVTDTGTRLVDLNGDGLVDVLRGRDSGAGTPLYTAWLNRGTSSGGRWAEIPAYGPKAPPYPLTGQAAFMDRNGDGLQDILFTTQQKFYMNTGHGWRLGPDLPVSIASPNGARFADVNGDGMPDMLGYISGANQLYLEGRGLSPHSYPGSWASSDYWDLMDINADGALDIVAGRGSRDIYLNRGLRVDLLTGVKDGLGARVSVSYRNLNEALPGPDSFYVRGAGGGYPLREIIPQTAVVIDVRLEGGGHNTGTSYRYGPMRADMRGHGDCGFEWVESRDEATGRRSRTEYRQDFPYIGLPKKVEQFLKDGSLAQSVVTAYAPAGAITLRPLTPRLVYPVEAVETNFENGVETSRVTREFIADTMGNVTQMRITTEGNGEPRIQTVQTDYLNDTSTWIVGRPLNVTTAWQTGTSGVPLLRNSAMQYDPATGHLLSETVEPGTEYELRRSYAYDLTGNRVKTVISAAGIEPRTATLAYDGAGRFLRKSTNAAGQVERMEFDPVLGLPRWIEDIRGLRTVFEYDSAGRAVRTVTPDGNSTVTVHSWDRVTTVPATGANHSPQRTLRAAYRISASHSAGGVRIDWFDSMARPVRSEHTGADGRMVRTDTEYDAAGRQRAVSLPWFSGQVPRYSVTTYDDRNRIVRIDNADATFSTVSYTGFLTTKTNENGQRRTAEFNGSGQLIRSEDHLGQNVTYRYDPLGNLALTDDGSVQVRMTYNVLGQRTEIDDPNTGRRTTTYNALGEVTSERDAKGQITRYEYDVLGRHVLRHAPEGTTQWVWDNAPGAAAGLPASVTAPDHVQQFRYDALGRMTGQTHVTNGQAFHSASIFDSAGRLDTAVYPTGFAVRYGYSASGAPDRVTNAATGRVYWEAESYDPFGNAGVARLGNGLIEGADHDLGTGRLRSRQVIQPLLSGQPVQDLRFSYDPLGNLTQRSDARRGVSESFTYDGLNRLTSARAGSALPVTFAYNGRGAITLRSDTGSYSYASPAVDRVTAVAGTVNATYQYDANGNQTSGSNGRTISYTSFNKPATVTDSGTVHLYQYGAENQIISERIRTGWEEKHTVRPDDLYELETTDSDYRTAATVNSVRHIHHIRAGGRTVAVHTMVERAGGTKDSADRWLHRDHLGSITAVSDASGKLVQEFSYDAFGKRRLSDWQQGTPAVAAGEFDFRSRGYTGHFSNTGSDLIHMGGRLYDAALGRFLSADPLVQSLTNRQAFNRYSYGLNNPLRFTDPSGYGFLDKVGSGISSGLSWVGDQAKKHFGGVGRIAVSYFLGFGLLGASEKVGNWFEENWRTVAVVTAAVVVTAFASPVAGGAVAGGLNAALYGGGTKEILTGAAIGAATAAVSGFAGSMTSGISNPVSRHLVTAAIEAPLQGVVTGLGAKVQGGSFSEGFKSGALGALSTGAQRAGSASGIIPRFGESSLSEQGAQAISDATRSVLLNKDPVNGALLGLYGHALGEGIARTDAYQRHQQQMEIEWQKRQGRLYASAESRAEYREGLANYRTGKDRSLVNDLYWMVKAVPHIVDRQWERAWAPQDNPAVVKPYSSGEFDEMQDIPDQANETIRGIR